MNAPLCGMVIWWITPPSLWVQRTLHREKPPWLPGSGNRWLERSSPRPSLPLLLQQAAFRSLLCALSHLLGISIQTKHHRVTSISWRSTSCSAPCWWEGFLLLLYLAWIVICPEACLIIAWDPWCSFSEARVLFRAWWSVHRLNSWPNIYGLSLSKVQTNQIPLLDRSQVLSFGNNFSEIQKSSMFYVLKVLIITSNPVSAASVAIMKGFKKSEASKMDKEITACLNSWEISQQTLMSLLSLCKTAQQTGYNSKWGKF